MTKKNQCAMYVEKVESIFKCPICSSPMKVFELKSLICLNHNHTFDFTKQGYLNFMTQQIKSNYSKELFEARRKLMKESGFFVPLSDAIAKIIEKEKGIISNDDSLMIIDTGCGEGSHLATICDTVSAQLNHSVTGVGIDICKEGILVAAKNEENKIWLVADLANTPFNDNEFDVILNILSPSNYAEFNRLLKQDGCVIKVVPKGDYLKELREFFFDETDKQTYSNEKTVDHFNKHFESVQCIPLRYTKRLDKAAVESLVRMTPLTWAISDERVQQFLDKDINEITV
ncbi:MAG: putative RNA methyltransferase, partial [Bacillaceae bacterium]